MTKQKRKTSKLEDKTVQLLKTDFCPLLAKAFRENLEKRIAKCEGVSLINLTAELNQFYNDLKEGVIYSPYETLSENNTVYGNKYVRKSPLTEKIKVEYSGPYNHFGEAVRDFLGQSKLTQQRLSGIACISTRTVSDLIHNSPPKHPTKFSIKQSKGQEQARDRLISVFDITPPEHEDKLYEIPMYGKDCKPRS